jgi:hypothetical protein
MIPKSQLRDAWGPSGVYRTKKQMRTVTMTRTETGPDGTLGNFVTDSGYQCYFVERPWAENKKGISCILPGPGDTASYRCGIVNSPKYGKVYGVQNVVGREFILIHPANWARQLEGCIALGRAIGEVMGEHGVIGSRDAVEGFMADMEGEPFTLVIKWAPGVGLNPGS